MKSNDGFGLVGAIVVLVVLTAVSFAGWYVWQSNIESDNNTPNSSQELQDEQDVVTKSISLANESVTFSILESWAGGLNPGCDEGAPLFGNEKLVDSIELIDEHRDSADYESNSPYFHVNLCVFENPDRQTAAEWANSTDAGASIGYPSENDEESTDDISGYSAYYVKFTAEEHSGLEDVYYVLSADDKIVYVSSRLMGLFEKYPNESAETSMAPYSYTQYEAAVKDIVDSISIN